MVIKFLKEFLDQFFVVSRSRLISGCNITIQNDWFVPISCLNIGAHDTVSAYAIAPCFGLDESIIIVQSPGSTLG